MKVLAVRQKKLDKFMKIKTIFLTMVCFGGVLFSRDSLFDYQEPITLCIGNIVFPQKINPDLSIYYKGNKVQIDVEPKKEIDIVPFSFMEEKSTQKIHVLICSELKFSSDDNTIKYLYAPFEVSYKFYTLSASRKRNSDGEMAGYLWTINQETLPDDRCLPDNSMIFLFDADLISGLEVKEWTRDNNTRFLPNIVIKKSATAQMLSQAIVKSRLAAIDVDTFHTNNGMCVKTIGKQVVAMVAK